MAERRMKGIKREREGGERHSDRVDKRGNQ